VSISLSKFKRKRRLSKKQYLKDQMNIEKVKIEIDPIEVHRFNHSFVEEMTKFMEARNAILSKIGINKSTGNGNSGQETISGRDDSIHGESIQSKEPSES
jgi:hypothetical protein